MREDPRLNELLTAQRATDIPHLLMAVAQGGSQEREHARRIEETGRACCKPHNSAQML